MEENRLAFAVLGPGGVGGFLAGALARGGGQVVVLASETSAGPIAENGLRVESALLGNFSVMPEVAVRLSRPVDACFVAVKATQLEEAVDRVPRAVLGDGLVIPLLNGLDHVDFLRSIYAPARVVAAAIRIESIRIEPGSIRQTSPFARIDVAPSDENRQQMARIATALSAAGLDVRLRDGEQAVLWEKFAFLAPMALLTTHERGNAGVIRTARRDDFLALAAEAAAVARVEGVAVDAQALVRFLDSVPASMETSMQRDQAAGKPLELDALGGALLRRAAKHDLDLPVTRRIVEELVARTGSRLAAGRIS